jgi:hypothetical protein
MSYAYIVYPDVCLDALDEKSQNNTYSKLFLGELIKEKQRVCTIQTKRFFGFIPDFHWKKILEIILDLLKKENINENEINVIQVVLGSLERDGIEDYPYMDNFTPLLDLAKDKSDSHDVVIVCNNPIITSRIKGFMKNNFHLGSYYILSAREGYLNLINP